MITVQIGGTRRGQCLPQVPHAGFQVYMRSWTIRARADHAMRTHLMETLESMRDHSKTYVSEYASMQKQMNALHTEHMETLFASSKAKQLWNNVLNDCNQKYHMWTKHYTYIECALKNIDRRRTKNSSLEHIIQQLKEAETIIQQGIHVQDLERQYKTIQLEINSWVNTSF